MPKASDTIDVRNVNHPEKVYRVDRAMYEAMRVAYLKVVPDAPPGVTIAEIRDRLLPLLPAPLFPGGAKAGWWAKTVQLDLEARGLLVRSATSPVRLCRKNQP